MDEEGAKKLVRDAITAGIINDMGSGSNVDIAVIKPGDDITYFRYVAHLSKRTCDLKQNGTQEKVPFFGIVVSALSSGVVFFCSKC